MKRVLLTTVSLLMALIGLVWFFQGIGVIKGSFMTSQTKWAAIGVVMIVAASVIFTLGRLGEKKGS